MTTYTTLNKIRGHGPCSDGWARLLRHLGKTQADAALMVRHGMRRSASFQSPLCGGLVRSFMHVDGSA